MSLEVLINKVGKNEGMLIASTLVNAPAKVTSFTMRSYIKSKHNSYHFSDFETRVLMFDLGRLKKMPKK